MARRRMFSKDIVNSARFLKLPQLARLLYYDLGMAADDDGVVEAYTVLLTTGAQEPMLDLLEQKGFVRVLNEDLVTLIVDWKRNNLIKKDRYSPSIYAYLLPNEDGTKTEPIWNPFGTQMEPQVRRGEGRIGKERLVQGRGEVGEGGKAASAPNLPFPPSLADVNDYIKTHDLGVDGRKFHQHFAERGWMQDNGKPIGPWWGKRLERWAKNEWNSPTQMQPAADGKSPGAVGNNQEEMKKLLERLNEGET